MRTSRTSASGRKPRLGASLSQSLSRALTQARCATPAARSSSAITRKAPPNSAIRERTLVRSSARGNDPRNRSSGTSRPHEIAEQKLRHLPDCTARGGPRVGEPDGVAVQDRAIDLQVVDDEPVAHQSPKEVPLAHRGEPQEGPPRLSHGANPVDRDSNRGG